MSHYSFILSNKYWNIHDYNYTEAKQILLIGVEDLMRVRF